jgi:hypothetical protein
MANSRWLGGGALNTGAFGRLVALAGALDLATGALTVEGELGLLRERPAAAHANELVVTQSVDLFRRKAMATQPISSRLEIVTSASPSFIRVGSGEELALLSGFLLWATIDEIEADATLSISGTLFPYDDILTADDGELTLDHDPPELIRVRPLAADGDTLAIASETMEQLRAGFSASASLTVSGWGSWNVYDDSEGITYSYFGSVEPLTLTAEPFAYPNDLVTSTPLRSTSAQLSVGQLSVGMTRRRRVTSDTAPIVLQDSVTARLRRSVAASSSATLTVAPTNLPLIRAALRSTSAMLEVTPHGVTMVKDMTLGFAAGMATVMAADAPTVVMRRIFDDDDVLALTGEADIRHAQKLYSAIAVVTAEAVGELRTAVRMGLPSPGPELVVTAFVDMRRVLTMPSADGACTVSATAESRLAVRMDLPAGGAPLAVSASAVLERQFSLSGDSVLAVLETEADFITNMASPAPQERTFVEAARDAAFVAEQETRTFHVT